jgi:hypothetical protein
MTVLFSADAYTDEPKTRSGRPKERIRQIKCACWVDPSDTELRELLATAEAALRALDRAGGKESAA